MDETRSHDTLGELKSLSRQQIRLIWEIAQLGGPLRDEDTRLVKAMREHPEYAHLWGRLDELSDEQIERGGVNPIMHVIIHSVLEGQIAGGEPAEVSQTIEELVRRGLSRYEAIHRVGAVLAEEIWHILKEDRPFDAPTFRQGLQQLLEQKGPPPGRFTKRERRRRKR